MHMRTRSTNRFQSSTHRDESRHLGRNPYLCLRPYVAPRCAATIRTSSARAVAALIWQGTITGNLSSSEKLAASSRAALSCSPPIRDASSPSLLSRRGLLAASLQKHPSTPFYYVPGASAGTQAISREVNLGTSVDCTPCAIVYQTTCYQGVVLLYSDGRTYDEWL
eukprot:IDg22464t1